MIHNNKIKAIYYLQVCLVPLVFLRLYLYMSSVKKNNFIIHKAYLARDKSVC